MAQTNLIDGRSIAAQIQGELAQRIAGLRAHGVQPGLAFVRVGEDPASKVYVGRKQKSCAELGIFPETHVLPEATREADMVKPGAVVIDVGVNRVSDPRATGGSRLVGDVAFAEVQSIAGRITPNPGGVGPMTIVMLMQETVRAAERSL